MRNAISSTDQFIYRVIEIRFDNNGHVYASSHHGWTVVDEDEVVQCQIFRRDNWRIKVVVYRVEIEYLETFGAYLCAGLVDRDLHPAVWRTVELNAHG